MGGRRYSSSTKIRYHNAQQENIITWGDKSTDKKVNRDIVLLLGNTGSGKSTLAQYIVGHLNHLTSVKSGTDYVIIDDKGKVSRKSTIISKTLYPELIEDPETHNNLYDCPGFSDTRSAAHEITATYFTKKIIDSARSVKLVFTVNHSSVREGNDRNDFMELLQHATNLIKNINKFKNSIILIVTKVEELGETDNEIISSIANFITSVKTDLEQNSFPSFGENFCTQAIEFINAILTNTEGNFQKIGIFKRPKAIGKLSTMQSYKSERGALNKMLKENIQYTIVGKDDFGFTVSDRTKNNISRWVDEVCNDINSELAKVEKQIIEYFKDQEQFYSLKLSQVKSLFNEAFDLFSQSQKNDDAMTSQEFIEKLILLFKNLKIDVVLKSMFLIHSHENFLSFLYLLSKQSKPKNGYLVKGLSNATKYLDESNKWYNFLYSFYSHLSDYSIQKDISKYNIIAIEEKINQQNENIKFKDIQALIQDVIDNCNIKPELLDVRDLILNKYKLNALTNVLKFCLGHKVSTVCSENTLTIQGHYTKLSDVDKIIQNCGVKITIIEILALHKIFIDTNLNKVGKKLGLIIISPTWDIISDSKIILDGAPGQTISTVNAQLMNQTDPDGNGLDGQPGRLGGPAGSFFGIGKTFLNLNKQDLLITAVGGIGENGGNGGDGKNGEDGIGPAAQASKGPFFIANIMEEWINKKFIFETNQEKPTFRSSAGAIGEFYLEPRFTIYGRNATPGGNGGNAGAGGIGGNGGRITIIGLNGNSNIKTKDGKGKNGKNGLPGKGGKGAKNSELIKISCSQGTESYCKLTEIKPYGGWSSHGKSGMPAKNTSEAINSPEIVTYEKQYPLSINKFKNYLRSNLKNSLNGTFLIDFFNELENHEQVINCYDALSLTDELWGLESQYYNLHKEIPLLPFYQSLLKRISSYAKKLEMEGNSAQYKRVLWYLYATVLSKLSSINNSFDSKLVVDIKAYLDSIEMNINELKESFHQAKIDEFFNNYKKLLENKTNDLNQFVVTQIKPDIEDIFQQIMSNLRIELIKEISALEIKFTSEKNQLSYKQKEMEQMFAKRKLIDAIRISSYLLLSLIGAGDIAIAVVDLAISIPNFFVSEEQHFSDVVITKMPEGMTVLSNMIRERNQLLFQQLSDVNQEFINFQNEYSSVALKDAQREIKYALGMLEKNMKEDENPEEIETIKEKISEMLTPEIDKLNTGNDNSTTTQRKVKILNRIQNILNIDSDLYDSFKENKSQLQVLGYEISQADSKLRKIRLNHQAIYKIIIPKVVDLKSELQRMLNAIHKKSHIPIEVSKWEIQNTINDLFTLIYKITKEFNVEEKIMSCIKKLQEGMMAIIDIYKTIQHYQSEHQLHFYLKSISSKESLQIETNDGELNDAIHKLDTMIQSNLVLSQYQKAISMFKQYIFPFAHFYLSEFSLPTELQPERNIDSLVSFAVKNLVNLKTRISDSNLSIGCFDKHINSDIPFSSDHNKSPFFIWSYDKHKDAISRLLEGKEIFLEADITKICNMNAVKFNVIGLKFKASDKNIQGDLDEKIDDFEVNLTHLGSSNYRCGDKIYIIKHDKVHFKFSLKMSDGVPITRNRVYDKIKNKDFMLSPYTMWSIMLNNISGSFNELKAFREHEINLELEGSGQYVDEEINKSVCVDDMSNYYTINKILSEIENADETFLNNTSTDGKNPLINQFNNVDYKHKRERRQLNINNLSMGKSGESFAINRGSSIFRESLINNIFNLASRSFKSFGYLNPLTYINSWFELSTKYNAHNLLWELSSKTTSERSMMRGETVMNFHSNLVFWDFFLKKYIGIKQNRKNSSGISCSDKNYKLKNNESHCDFASSLAYNYYFNKYNKK